MGNAWSCGRRPTPGPLLGAAAQVRHGAEPAWIPRLCAWVLGCASLGLWMAAPAVAFTGFVVWVVACVSAFAGLVGSPRDMKMAAATLVGLAAVAALFIWFYGALMQQTDFPIEAFVAPNATAFVSIWGVALVRRRSGPVLF